MQHFNQDTLEVANTEALQQPKVHHYTTRTGEKIYFSLIGVGDYTVYLAAHAPDMRDAWVTNDLEQYGLPL
tara:strand:+ start:45 stop:257 length:213 start_codon:yes stop_codon:yes gene_type:complete